MLPKKYFAIFLLAALEWGCEMPPHEPFLINISGAVVNVAETDVPFDGSSAAAMVSVVDSGVILLGSDVPPLGSAAVGGDGSFFVSAVDVGLTGIESPLLAIVDDTDNATGSKCHDQYLGGLFPTTSGITLARPKTAAERSDIDGAYVFTVTTVVARMLTDISASVAGPPLTAEDLLCSRGFIVGVVARIDGEEPIPVAGAVVTPPAVVERVIYLRRSGSGLLEQNDAEETSDVGAFVAWFREDYLAAYASDFSDFGFSAQTPTDAFSGMGFALPTMACVAVLLPEGTIF